MLALKIIKVILIDFKIKKEKLPGDQRSRPPVDVLHSTYVRFDNDSKRFTRIDIQKNRKIIHVLRKQ